MSAEKAVPDWRKAMELLSGPALSISDEIYQGGKFPDSRPSSSFFLSLNDDSIIIQFIYKRS